MSEPNILDSERIKYEKQIAELKENLDAVRNCLSSSRKENKKLEEKITQHGIDNGVEALFGWSLSVQCPECKQDIDLADENDNDKNWFYGPLLGNDWDKIRGAEIPCNNPECECKFVIKEVVY